ncbi:MAG: DUF1801 domain-containing protein [Longimicrobiales bacterium]
MAQSDARTVEEYLLDLPSEKREVVAKLRSVILEHLPPGYQETMNWGMIAYEVPLERYPDTYNNKPLLYMALAAQKNHFAVYTTGVYMDPDGEAWVRSEFEKAGKKLDMGKSCIRFRRLENVPLEVFGKIAGGQTVEEFLEAYERVGRRK